MTKKNNPLGNLALISHIGIAMTLPIILGLYLGRWIDDKFNSQPLFLFVFIILGVITAFVNLFRIATKGTPAKKRK